MNTPNELYLFHLLNSLQFHKQNALDQKGKSDLDSYGYGQNMELWFEQIYDYVLSIPPEYYVNAIDVYENEERQIIKIEYTYFPESEVKWRVGNAIINLAKEP